MNRHVWRLFVLSLLNDFIHRVSLPKGLEVLNETPAWSLCIYK